MCVRGGQGGDLGRRDVMDSTLQSEASQERRGEESRGEEKRGENGTVLLIES